MAHLPKVRFLPLLCVIALTGPLMAQDDLAPLVHETVVDASPDQVWKIFTTAEGFRVMGVAKAEVDLRIGGTIRSHYKADGKLGDDESIENTILAYEPHRMLALEAARAPKSSPFPKEVMDRTWSVIHLTDFGQGRTRITIRGYGYGTDEASLTMRRFFEQGNQWTLERIKRHFGMSGTTETDEGKLRAPIECSVLAHLTPAQAFKAWTTEAGISAFLEVPTKLDFRPGGQLELHFAPTAPEGMRGTEGCQILAWIPERMLAFSWNAPPHLKEVRKERTFVVLTFEPEGTTHTRVRLSHGGFEENIRAMPTLKDEWLAARAYFAKAWPNVLGKFESFHHK